MERVGAESGFLLCFSGVFAACRNVFPISWLGHLVCVGEDFGKVRALFVCGVCDRLKK